MTQQKTLRDSAAMRWTALLLLALAMFCAYIFMDILSPIKDLMLETRGWDSTAFGTMQGAETFLNVFVFFLIFAGIILDTCLHPGDEVLHKYLFYTLYYMLIFGAAKLHIFHDSYK